MTASRSAGSAHPTSELETFGTGHRCADSAFSDAVSAHRLAAEVQSAVTAARAGGGAVLGHYGSIESESKLGGSPVTAADRDSSAVILERIRAAFPLDPILCEETADSPGRLDAQRLWIVDPLDGTREFLSQNGEFSVMIGLVEDGYPVLGVVYVPATDTLYVGLDGAGAWVDRCGTIGRLKREPATEGLRLVTSRSHADAAVEAIAAALPVSARRPCGSVGIKCALIAEGECDVYVHPVAFMGEWDTCAPEAVLREAGGIVSDCEGSPLRYNKPDPRQPRGILACGPGLLDLVTSAVRSSCVISGG